LREYLCRVRLGAVEETTLLSTELARLDREGFGDRLAEALLQQFPEEMEGVLARLPAAINRVEMQEQAGMGERKTGARGISPRKLLTGWHAITKALEIPYSQRKDVKSLNQRLQGPIENAGRGTQPMVYRDDLVEWWNKLDILQQERANQREGAQLSAEAQHNYGREGNAAPEIGGGVKKRRKDKRA
jgi:hypothetical protein